MHITPGSGGRHALMGTHNRVFAIGSEAFPRAYFEIIAIDPDAPDPAARLAARTLVIMPPRPSADPAPPAPCPVPPCPLPVTVVYPEHAWVLRALRDLRLSGIAATLSTRVMQAQTTQEPFLDTFAAMLQDNKRALAYGYRTGGLGGAVSAMPTVSGTGGALQFIAPATTMRASYEVTGSSMYFVIFSSPA